MVGQMRQVTSLPLQGRQTSVGFADTPFEKGGWDCSLPSALAKCPPPSPAIKGSSVAGRSACLLPQAGEENGYGIVKQSRPNFAGGDETGKARDNDDF